MQTTKQQAPEQGNFWVLGGEYASMEFDTILQGTERVLGPVKTRAEAERIWRSLSEATRHKGATRFSIVVEAKGH